MPERSNPHQSVELLWHYTSVNGLHGILRSEAMWGTHVRFLNDIRETIHGYEYLRKKLAESLGPTLSKVAGDTNIWPSGIPTFARYILGGVLTVGVHASVSYINDNILTNEMGPFVTCLSKARDQLSQWRGYAGDGGYAIGFDPVGLKMSIKPQRREDRPAPSDQSLGFGPVQPHTSRLVEMAYNLDSEDSIDQEIGDALTTLVAHLNKLADTSTGMPDEAMSNVMNRILTILTERKHPAFEDEREHRIITFEYPDPDMFHPKSSMGFIPRVAVEFDPGCVREIFVGPGGDTELRKFSIDYFVKHDPRYGHVKVEESGVPFRTS